jgi:uncharacterized protein (TIGR03435 family)
LLGFLVVFCTALPAAPQDPAPPLRFEVASIKPVDPNAFHTVGINVFPGGRVVLSGMPLKALICAAFRLSYWQIAGGDGWTAKDAYDIEAKPPESLQPRIRDLRHTLFGIEDESLRRMLQAMLVERFQLQFHRESKTGDVYTLERNGKSLQLHASELQAPSGDSAAAPRSFGSIGYANARWTIAATAMPQLAKFASDYVVHAPVVDGTELSGSFDYRQPVADSEPNYADNTDSFLRLLAEVGLKLVRSRGPVEIFGIDHAARPSSD